MIGFLFKGLPKTFSCIPKGSLTLC